MSFEFSVVTKDGLVLEEESTLMKLIELYVDFKNYTANKIDWQHVRDSLADKRQYLKEQGVLINAIDDKLEAIIEFDEANNV